MLRSLVGSEMCIRDSPNVLGMAELAKVAVSTIREYFDNLENN